MLTGALLVAIYVKAPRVLIVKEVKERLEEAPSEEQEEKNQFPMILSIATIAFGTFVFVFYLIKYIKSFYGYKDDTAVGYDFDPDSMLIFILGLFLTVLGVNNLIKYLKNKFSYIAYSGILTVLTVIDLVYCLARLIRMYVKEKEPYIYWIWLVIGLLLFAGSLTWFIITLARQKKEKES